jgi:hypothetical protein
MPRPKLPPGVALTGAQRAAKARAKAQEEKGLAVYLAEEAARKVESRANVKLTETPEEHRRRVDASNDRVCHCCLIQYAHVIYIIVIRKACNLILVNIVIGKACYLILVNISNQ